MQLGRGVCVWGGGLQPPESPLLNSTTVLVCKKLVTFCVYLNVLLWGTSLCFTKHEICVTQNKATWWLWWATSSSSTNMSSHVFSYMNFSVNGKRFLVSEFKSPQYVHDVFLAEGTFNGDRIDFFIRSYWLSVLMPFNGLVHFQW